MSRKRERLVVVSNRGPYRAVTSGGERRRVRTAGGAVDARVERQLERIAAALVPGADGP